jgi:hypothetical protein
VEIVVGAAARETVSAGVLVLGTGAAGGWTDGGLTGVAASAMVGVVAVESLVAARGSVEPATVSVVDVGTSGAVWTRSVSLAFPGAFGLESETSRAQIGVSDAVGGWTDGGVVAETASATVGGVAAISLVVGVYRDVGAARWALLVSASTAGCAERAILFGGVLGVRCPVWARRASSVLLRALGPASENSPAEVGVVDPGVVSVGAPGAAGGWTDGGVVGATGVGESARNWTERAMVSVAVSRVTSGAPGAAGGWTDGVVGSTGMGESALRETERAMGSVAVLRVTSDAPGAAWGWTEGGRPGATASETVGVVAVSRLVAVGESAAA